ncbi:hypothetical protein DRO97_05660 [Archaeoglobales archaeon]|nr:MAG: hypothetical protein DRO97_05660 [Archaeoglobales archaeon]
MMNWVYERIVLVKKACSEVNLENVAIFIPMEYKSAVLIKELSKITNVFPFVVDDPTIKKDALEWLKANGIEVYKLDELKFVDANYYLDCAAVLIRKARKLGILDKVDGVVELTKTGVDILKKFKIKKAISVDNSTIKGVGENIYGTALGLLDGLLRLNIYLPDKTIAIVGFGRVGEGCAKILKNLGCRVLVVEKDRIRQFVAKMQGFEVVDLKDALNADIVVTCVGDRAIINDEMIEYIKDGAILCNMSAVKDEIKFDLKPKKLGFIDKYEINSKHFYVVSGGYAINLALGYGTAIDVMDRTFAAAVYALEYVMKEEFEGLIDLPKEIEEKVLGLVV